jgi:CHAT domain-containing protein/Tfp pilus assembly protein PilF
VPAKRIVAGVAMLMLAILTWLALERRGSSESRRVAEVEETVRQGFYETGVAATRELLAQAEAEDDSARVADRLDLLVLALWRYGKAGDAETLELAERSLRIRERLFGPDAGPVVESLIGISRIVDDRGQHDVAIRHLERALAIAQAHFEPLDPRNAKVLAGLGYAFFRLGDFTTAREQLEQALEIARHSPNADPLEEAAILNGLAVIDKGVLGDYTSARARYERILDIRRAHLRTDHPLLAGTYNNLGLVLKDLGDDEAARELFTRAIKIRTKVDPELPRLASSLNNLAILLEKAGELDAAQQNYERALHIISKAYGERHPSAATLQHNLGWIRYVQSDFAAADSYYVRAYKTCEANFGPDHIGISDILLDLGILRYQLGDVDSALVLYRRNLAIAEKNLGPEHPDVAVTLGYMSFALTDAGDPMGALDAALRAESIGREHMQMTSRTLAEREALLYSGARVRGLELALHLNASESVPAATTPLVWDALIHSRALVLDEMATRSRGVSQSIAPEVEQLASELAATRNRLAALAVRGAGGDLEAYRRDLAATRREKELNERRLAAVSATFRQQLARNRLGFDDVQRSLPVGSALVAYSIYDLPPGWKQGGDSGSKSRPAIPFGSRLRARVPHLVALVLRPGQPPRAVPLGTMSNVRSVVDAWAREAAFGVMLSGRTDGQALEAYEQRAASLRQSVWDPLVTALGGARMVFVVPDGVLHQINLAALPDSSGRYLIESGRRFHYLASERDLVTGDMDATTGVGLLAFGGPDYEEIGALTPSVVSAESPTDVVYRSPRYRSTQPCASLDALVFPPLPGTALEVQAIQAIWNRRGTLAPGTILTGSEATEARFKQSGPGKRVLHLATHGFFLGGLCPTGAQLGRGIEGAKGSARARWGPTPVTSPLLLCGLAMAGANQRASKEPHQEDGILTGEEIAALDLEGVQLAVLSACDTGVGQVLAGEGVLGLRRAFQIAGVRSLVMSLWSVSDEPTREWMEQLYGALFDAGMGTADATHHASLRILQARRASGSNTHPFFWASFVSAGDWR